MPLSMYITTIISIMNVDEVVRQLEERQGALVIHACIPSLQA